MTERIFVQGNEAVGWGALTAGVEAFFGYPITPVNEITEWCAREFPKRGKVFLQTTSETSSINMLFGAASTGKRAFTATSGPGWGLMQETLSHMATAQVPGVVELCSRGGPGQGTTRHGQTEYYSATRGGGQGNYRTIVVAPASAQEMHDFIQLSFHLAEQYRNPAIILADGIIGQTAEPVELREIDYGPAADKDWALRGRGCHADGNRRIVTDGEGSIARTYPPPSDMSVLKHWRTLYEKYCLIESREVRYEDFRTQDADLVLVAYGYVSRVCKEAVMAARAQGLRAGLLRPITLWPFPSKVLAGLAKSRQFLVVEDCFGQMVDDVRLAVNGTAPVNFMGVFARHLTSDAGAILPTRVLAEVRQIMGATN